MNPLSDVISKSLTVSVNKRPDNTFLESAIERLREDLRMLRIRVSDLEHEVHSPDSSDPSYDPLVGMDDSSSDQDVPFGYGLIEKEK